jgi:GAF domain-containing protein
MSGWACHAELHVIAEMNVMLFSRPYPVSPNEASRMAELKRYEILDTPPERTLDDVVRLASSLFQAETSTISLIDDDRQWFKAKFGTETCETGRSEAFCAHTILSKDVMVVLDATHDPRFAANPLVVGPPFIRFYAGCPIARPDMFNIGRLGVLDSRPRSAFGKHDRRQLAALAEIAAAEINKRIARFDQRNDERFSVVAEGIISNYSIKPSVVDIVNVSARGAMIRCRDMALPKGEEIILSIGRIVLTATVAWSRENMEGLTFHRALDPAELLSFRRDEEDGEG